AVGHTGGVLIALAKIALGRELLGLLLARRVDVAGVGALGHRDVVVRAAARAIRAADAEVVDVDLAILLAMDGAGRAPDHALGIGAVVTARRDQDVLVMAFAESALATAQLLAAARDAARPMPIVAARRAVATAHALLEIDDEQRGRLDLSVAE